MVEEKGLQIFENSEFGKVRTVEIDGVIWFVAKDVAESLEYTWAGIATIKHVPDIWRGVNSVQTPSGMQEMLCLTEEGLYFFVNRSDKEKALPYQMWISSDVLPSIRKHGAYISPETLDKMIMTPEFGIRLLQEIQKEREEKQIALAEKQAALQEKQIALEEKSKAVAKIEADKPKVIFAEAVQVSNSLILIRDLAKILKQNGIDIGGKRLFEYLRETGYLCLDNTPTQKAMNLELFKIKETVILTSGDNAIIKITPKVTGKGQTYFIDKFMQAKNMLAETSSEPELMEA